MRRGVYSDVILVLSWILCVLSSDYFNVMQYPALPFGSELLIMEALTDSPSASVLERSS